MHIAITGATGFLGSHLAEAFHQHGHHVTGVVRPSSTPNFLESMGAHVQRATLEDPATLRHAFSGADVVIHAAAKVHTHGRWSDFVRTTIEGTARTLEAACAAGVHHFIHVSTVGVYGFPKPGSPPFDESAGTGNIHRWNYYSRSKIEAERIARAAHDAGRIAVTILRPTWVYGPRDTTTLARIVDALRRRRMKWIGDGTNRLSLVYATDVARAFVLAATIPHARGQTYNIVADETSPTQREFLQAICSLWDLPAPTGTMSYRTAYALGFAGECIAHWSGYRICPPLTRLTALLFGGQRRFSGEKIRRELGWVPAVSFADGIRQVAAWYQTHGNP